MFYFIYIIQIKVSTKCNIILKKTPISIRLILILAIKITLVVYSENLYSIIHSTYENI